MPNLGLCSRLLGIERQKEEELALTNVIDAKNSTRDGRWTIARLLDYGLKKLLPGE